MYIGRNDRGFTMDELPERHHPCKGSASVTRHTNYVRAKIQAGKATLGPRAAATGRRQTCRSTRANERRETTGSAIHPNACVGLEQSPANGNTRKTRFRLSPSPCHWVVSVEIRIRLGPREKERDTLPERCAIVVSVGMPACLHTRPSSTAPASCQ